MNQGPPSLLLLEDDEAIIDSLQWLFEDAGYLFTSATTPTTAVQLLDTHTYHCVIMDLFGATQEQRLATAAHISLRAFPTPVGVISAYPLTAEQPELAAYAFVLAKPFDIDNLLSQIAASINIPLNPEQRTQAAVIEAYFAALSARDWEAVMALCADEVTYALQGQQTVVGKAAFRHYTEQTFQAFEEALFTNVQIYATPQGLAARYHGSWQTAGQPRSTLTGGVLFRFTGNQIAQIGVHLNLEALPGLPPLTDPSA